jgi:NitT/TauT family transport system ATP-binding protein
MFQKDHLFEWRNILNNVLFGLEIQNKLNEDTKSRTEKLLEMYRLGEFKDHYPRQLSGAMRQRVVLIRTLANPA